MQVTGAARLGPSTSQYGLQLNLVDPSLQTAEAAYLRAIPEQSTNDRTRLNGSFFIDPQDLTMSSADGLNRLPLFVFRDRVSNPRLAFTLTRAATDRWGGRWLKPGRSSMIASDQSPGIGRSCARRSAGVNAQEHHERGSIPAGAS